MKLTKNINYYLKLRDARLKELRAVKPFIDGSLVEIAHACGNPRCKCARGDKHIGYYLTSKSKGKTQTRYVPVGLYEEVQRWTAEYRYLKGIIKEINRIQRVIMKRYVKERGRMAVWQNKDTKKKHV